MSSSNLVDVTQHYRAYYNTLITKSSTKQLRKFINALDDKCLTDMIRMYINSIVKQPNYDRMTATETTKKMAKNELENNMNNNPNMNILSLFNTYCNKKKKKKRNIYQKESKLLSLLPMELMAHSLSYLQFNELSKVESVCVYFIHSSRKYRAISHGHLNINLKFLDFAFTNRINIDLLSHFQNIQISDVYIGLRWGYKIKTFLYWKILTKIIKQSQQTVKSLNITPLSHGWRRTYYLEPIIYKLLNAVDNLPSLITLKWTREDEIKNFVDNNYETINKNIQIKCPLLQNIHVEECYWRPNAFSSKHKVFFKNNNINLISKLKILNLICDSYQLFKVNTMPLIIQNCKQLQTLNIACRISSSFNDNIKKEFISLNDLQSNASIIINKYNHKIHKSLKQLTLKLNNEGTTDACFDSSCNQLLIYFVLICVNLEEFILDFDACCFVDTDINWSLLFDIINANKIKYDSTTKLKKVSIKNNNEMHADHIMSALSVPLFSAKNFKYLQYIELDITQDISSNRYHYTNFNEVITKQLVPFLSKHISMGGNLKCIQFKSRICSHDLELDKIYEQYYKPIIFLLNNLPKSLKTLSLNCNGTDLDAPKSSKRYERYSMDLVKCLVKLSSEKENNNLEIIKFNGLYLHNASQKYLQFYFGFNNNYFHQNYRHNTDYALLFV